MYGERVIWASTFSRKVVGRPLSTGMLWYGMVHISTPYGSCVHTHTKVGERWKVALSFYVRNIGSSPLHAGKNSSGKWTLRRICSKNVWGGYNKISAWPKVFFFADYKSCKTRVTSSIFSPQQNFFSVRLTIIVGGGKKTIFRFAKSRL